MEGLDKSGSKVRVELASLKGNILAYPESDANFPESWIQRQSRWTALLQDATNPIVAKLLASVENRMAALDAVALEGLTDPDALAWEKQMGEFEVLLKSGPVPNPEYAQAQQAIQEATGKIQGQQAMGVPAQPQEIQAIQQMEQQLQTIPPEVSSVPIRDTDNHEVESACCSAKINGPEGRKLADGNEQDRLAFQNLTLHFSEHKAKVEAKAELPKPPSISINLKDLPPDSAAKLLQAVGLEATGPEVVQNREFGAELKKASHPMGGPVPGIQR